LEVYHISKLWGKMALAGDVYRLKNRKKKEKSLKNKKWR